ncbi:alpha/beta hydrolase [Streptomyces sp. WMMC500]|uniref:alpha/beta hydrolase n=1 Tax=Streptomyces sp. WMMC500 TaxID=3015154 RepID=UPI00248BE305|nr:alpha/beta hydrolase [Streptomyces sp. WMMC500]WBB63260.1 alpha/beta hydrolase [Streptomyces sp. WMMC500]
MRVTKPTTAAAVTAATAVTAVLLTALAAGGCGIASSSEHTSGREDGAAAGIHWGACKNLPSPAPGAPVAEIDWQCGTLDVPLDHEKPDGEKIGIAMIRAKATGPKTERIGSLLFNFGGPGGSGIDTIPGLAGQYKTLHKQYDLVSFDPRGVGRSDGVRCLGDRALDKYFAADNTPDDKAEEKAYLDRIHDFAAACEKRSGKVLPYVGTENAARDMDLMRAALGDDKMHYFGISYGTELGAVYAHLFPGRVGRAVLDSPVDPTQDSAQRSLAQAKGFQQALENYAEDCARQGGKCPLGDSAAGEGAVATDDVADLLKRLDGKPIPGSSGRDLTESLATGGIAQSLYSKQLWPLLTQGLQQAQDDDGATLLVLSDALNGREPDGHYNTLQSSFLAINCADTRDRYSTADVRDRLPEFRKASPVFGDFMAWGMASCDGWPVTGKRSTPQVSAKGADKILVVGSTGDPATPYEGTQRMVDALGGDVAVKLTRVGEGHGAYGSGNRCTQEAVDAYLLDGRAPRNDTTCRK